MQPVCSAVLQCSLIRIDVRGAAKRQLRGFPHRRCNFSPTNDIHTTAFTATIASSTSSRHSADTASRDRRPDARSVNFPPLHRPPQLRSDARRRHGTLHSPHQRDDDHTRQRRSGKGDLDIEETAQSICSTSSKLRHRWRRRTELRRHDTTSDTTSAIKVKRAGFRRLRMMAASLYLRPECSRESDMQPRYRRHLYLPATTTSRTAYTSRLSIATPACDWVCIASKADDDADIDLDGRANRSPSSGASASRADYRRHGEELAFDVHPSVGITVDLYHDTVVMRAGSALVVSYLRLQRDVCTASPDRPAACAATTPTPCKDSIHYYHTESRIYLKLAVP